MAVVAGIRHPGAVPFACRSVDPFATAIDQLSRWHAQQDRAALAEALHSLSDALPSLLAPRLARRLGEETVRDLVQQFLLDLQRRPLPTLPDHPRTYLGRALQNRALSLLRRKDAEPVPVVPEPLQEDLVAVQERRLAAREVLHALQGLSMEDRVALKLSEAPEELDGEELDWLAARGGASREGVRAACLRVERAEERAALFEGRQEPFDATEVQRAIDRLHKRVSRARQRLIERIGGAR